MSPTSGISKVLVANRGEIAIRIFRSCRLYSLATVAVFSDADRNAEFVRHADEAVYIGESEAKKSYLNIDKILDAAKRTGADAIHPGYGFLSENSAFARRVVDAGLIFIGPTADSIEAIGSKAQMNAKVLLRKCAQSVPLIPGYTGDDQSTETLAREAHRIGFPVLLKASGGGGGKGMRVVRAPEELLDAIESAKRESLNAFGDDRLLLERYFDQVKHIEVQIVGDAYGNVTHLFERECSVQRRFQKLIEESPSPVVDDTLRTLMTQAAITVGRTINYRGLGTVEFILDCSPAAQGTNAFYFLEVNTRLQVEHPITEAITGLDLVLLQLQIADGKSLWEAGLRDVRMSGHSIEVRLCAEDPENNFFPCTGRVLLWRQSSEPAVRYDSGVTSGSEFSVFYDPLVAKVVVWAESRHEAIKKMRATLKDTVVLGLTTNKRFLLDALAHPHFRDGTFKTSFIADFFPPSRPSAKLAAQQQAEAELAIVAMLWDWAADEARRTTLARVPSGWRNTRPSWQFRQFAMLATGEQQQRKSVKVEYTRQSLLSKTRHEFIVRIADKQHNVLLLSVDHAAGTLQCSIDGHSRVYQLADDGRQTLFIHSKSFGELSITRLPRLTISCDDDDEIQRASSYSAPMSARILKVLKRNDEQVKSGETVIVVESMKMENRIVAHKDGTARVYVKEGDLVEAGTQLIDIN